VRIHTIRDGAADTSLIPEIPRADAALGKPVILSPRPDPWTYVRAEPVFSIVRLIMGNTVPCYIEVQKTYRILDAVYNLRSDAIRVVVTDKNGGIFYSQLDRNGGRSPPGFRDSPGRAGKDITASYYSSYTGMYTFVIQNGAVIEKTFAYSAGMTLVSAVLVFLVSFAFIYILSVRITSPIRRLIENMERVTLDNMDLGVSFEPAHDEFERLRQSYNHFLKRLNRAIQQEKEMSLLHLQAEFDTLQAQVNPHFIYNVLNVISHRGVINGDETICEICEKLASMLRYSAGISRRTAAVREELEHLRHYLYLLKTRYQNKLEYAIDAGNSVMDQMIPKAVLQQLAENSVAHGFRNTLGIMTISVRGWTSGGCWYIEVRDNGQGFTDGEKAVLERKMEEIRKRIFEENLSLDMGGMGLINMYARFLILFGEGAVFRIANDGGAVVTIGASCTK
jgi:two-component system sensor histidine kinase YesM